MMRKVKIATDIIILAIGVCLSVISIFNMIPDLNYRIPFSILMLCMTLKPLYKLIEHLENNDE